MTGCGPAPRRRHWTGWSRRTARSRSISPPAPASFTRALQRRVTQVIAVEPDERMRAVLAARSPGVRAVAGQGEAIPVPDASADGVFVSSAWHWLDPGQAVPEIARVLHDGGRLGVI